MSPIEKDERLAFRLTTQLKRACEQAASRSGLTLSDWIRAVLARAAHEGAFAPPARGKRHGAKTTRKTAPD